MFILASSSTPVTRSFGVRWFLPLARLMRFSFSSWDLAPRSGPYVHQVFVQSTKSGLEYQTNDASRFQ